MLTATSRPAPLVTAISYVQTKDNLTISVNGQIIFLSDPNGELFQAISSENASTATDFLVGDRISVSQLQVALKMSNHKDFIPHAGKLFFASPDGLTEIDIELARRLMDLQAANLPHYPLLKFWTKFVQSPAYLESSDRLRQDLFQKIGTPAFPLTWDGNLVAYFRGHKQGMPSVLREDPNGSGLSFRSLDRTTMFDAEVETEINGRVFRTDSKPLYSLNRVTGACMDQGSIYEVEVNPVQITSFVVGSLDPSLFATTATGVRSLGLTTGERNSGFIEMPVAHCAGGLSLRDPSNDSATAAYLVELVGSDSRQLHSLANRQSSIPAIPVSGC